jgi:hypothetical protein
VQLDQQRRAALQPLAPAGLHRQPWAAVQHRSSPAEWQLHSVPLPEPQCQPQTLWPRRHIASVTGRAAALDN